MTDSINKATKIAYAYKDLADALAHRRDINPISLSAMDIRFTISGPNASPESALYLGRVLTGYVRANWKKIRKSLLKDSEVWVAKQKLLIESLEKDQ